MSIGKVTVWKMTEEERLAYIEKHPIISTEKPKGTTFESITEMQKKKAEENVKKQKRLTIAETIDNEKLHKLFMNGEPLNSIAKKLFISSSTLNNYIKEQRKIEPEKWPSRQPWRR